MSEKNSTSGVSSGSKVSSKGIGRGLGKKMKQARASADSLFGSKDSSPMITSPSGSNTSNLDSLCGQFSDTASIGSDTDVFSDALENPEELAGGDREIPQTFADCNCVCFEILEKMQVFCYSTEFEPDSLTPLEKLQALNNTHFRQNFVYDHNRIFTCTNIENLNQTLYVGTKRVSIHLNRLPSHQFTMESFFMALLKRVSQFIQEQNNFLCLSILPELRRFELFPGKVLSVIEKENNYIVRCQSVPSNDVVYLSDIIEEASMYACAYGMSENALQEILDDNCKDLVFFSRLENELLVVLGFDWAERQTMSREKVEMFERLGLKPRPHDPIAICRAVDNQEDYIYVEPEALTFQGGKRIHNTKVDGVVDLVGSLLTGQQRQLAMVHFKEACLRTPPLNAFLRRFRIRLSDCTVMSNGVVLEDTAERRCNWSDWLSRHKVRSPVEIQDWSIIFCKGDEALVRYFEDAVRLNAPRLGLRVKPAKKVSISKDEPKYYVDGMKSSGKSCKLIVIVMRSNRDDVYKAIKKWSLVESHVPIATQVIKRDTARLAYLVNDICYSIVTQINCKLGGDLWSINVNLPKTFVAGLSVYTDGQGDDHLGYVASQNESFTQWFSRGFRLQNKSELRDSVTKSIALYRRVSRRSPDKVILFTHKFQFVQDNFMKEIRAILPKDVPLIVINILQASDIILQFENQETNADSIDSIKSLIYIKGSRMGEWIPLSVTYNEANLSMSEILRITYKFRLMYFNSPGEASLPAPCMYAAKCAEFVVEYLDGEQGDNLGPSLYYL